MVLPLEPSRILAARLQRVLCQEVVVMDDLLAECSHFEDGERIPTCMVLYYRDEDPTVCQRIETYRDGWVQVELTCMICGSSEVWVESE